MRMTSRSRTLAELKQSLGDAHWAARDIADRIPGATLRAVMEHLHTARKAAAALGLEPDAAK